MHTLFYNNLWLKLYHLSNIEQAHAKDIHSLVLVSNKFGGFLSRLEDDLFLLVDVLDKKTNEYVIKFTMSI